MKEGARMDAMQRVWKRIEDEILSMQWPDRLITAGLQAGGPDIAGRQGPSGLCRPAAAA